MYRIILALIAGVMLVTSCRKDENTDEMPWPVWILRVTVRDGDNPNPGMPSCAHVIWSYQGSVETHDWGCREANDYVKVWDHISGDSRIFFHVECDGYSPSTEYTVDYDYARVDTTDPQEEVIESRIVTLYRL
jgi:hypothetical protein